MKLEQTNSGFRAIIKVWRIYEALEVSPDIVPVGAKLIIEHTNDSETKITICRDCPFDIAVKSARAAQIAVSNIREGFNPYIKYNVDNWTPNKLADAQVKNKERNIRYNELLLKYKECTKIYNDALEAQKLEILSYTEL